MHDYSEFLRALRGESGRVSLAEPFIPRVIAEQLIWRRGAQLWDSAEHYVATLCELYAYIKSDVVFIDSRLYDARELVAQHTFLPDRMKFVITADMSSALDALMDDSVCAVMSDELDIAARIPDKPCVYLCHDNSGSAKSWLETAAERGFAGIYLPRLDEELIRSAAAHSIALLGGVGVDDINKTQPLDIYNRVERLVKCGLKLVGSGGFGEPVEYLGYISMLGKYQKLL